MYESEAIEQQRGLAALINANNGRIPLRHRFLAFFLDSEQRGIRVPPGSTFEDETGKLRSGWYYHPLIPGRNETWAPEEPEGRVRSVYTPKDPLDFQVMYFHDHRFRLARVAHDCTGNPAQLRRRQTSRSMTGSQLLQKRIQASPNFNPFSVLSGQY